MSHPPHALVIPIIALLAVARPAHPQSDHASLARRLDTFIDAEVRERRFPAVAVAVVKDGEVVLTRGYGLAKVETNTRATDSSVFEIASFTKLFTASAVMLLADERRLDIDDRISRYLPRLPLAWSAITVRQLLDHTSGIPNMTDLPAYAEFRLRDHPPQGAIDLVAALPLEFPPGTKYQYTNTGYIVLGMLIERISGAPYEDFLRRRIFAPLAMADTRLDADAGYGNPMRVRGYEWQGTALRATEPGAARNASSAGGLLSSARDLAKWDQSLYDGSILSRRSLETMWNAERPLGWDVETINGHRVMQHSGDIRGFSAHYLHFDADRLSVIVLVSGPGLLGNAPRLARMIAGEVVPELAPVREKPILDPDTAATTRFRRMVQARFIDGVIDGIPFTDEMAMRTTPEMLRGSREFHVLFGRVVRLELLARDTNPGLLRLRYRAVFEHGSAIAFIAVDANGRIAGMGLQSEP
jgi:CubicO group peptidase (beta-lactamase class C family)